MNISTKQKEWLWFVGLWFGGLFAVATMAYGIRLFMKMLGLLE